MDEQQYVADNALSYTYQDGLYVLTHPGWLGLIAPGGVQGTGETLAEAIADFMTVLADERAESAPAALLDGYVGQDGAAAAVVTAVSGGVAVDREALKNELRPAPVVIAPPLEAPDLGEGG